MRLMPPPLLFQAGGERVFDLAPALEGSEIELFYASSRLPVGPRDNRVYSVAPDWRLHLGKSALRIGEEETTLEQIREWTTRADTSDRPFIRLERMREMATLSTDEAPGPEAAAWFAEIDATLAASRSRDILVYIHGANTTVERAAGQAAQLRHFAGREAVVVLFAWPTAENFLRYARDIRTALGSAPQLAEIIELLAAHTGAAKIDVFTYSAGATVGSDGLALLARESATAADRLGEVYHAAPDADFRSFVDDLGDYGPHARRVTTAVNLGDSALRLAGAVNRASRAGRPDIRELSPEAAA
jgi:esterase/lipase superfamily enzyme